MRIKFSRFLLFALLVVLPVQSIAIIHAAPLRMPSAAATVLPAQIADTDQHCRTVEATDVCKLGCDSCATCSATEPGCLPDMFHPAAVGETPGVNGNLSPRYTSRIPALIPRPPALFA